ncbi:Sensor protein QseC [Roseovarius gaetbuli]|uniref:histidine kinase n=1 Tax=Roseovarius gaetbuli TaxID=1356575 RepID=A0A1X7A1L0_9RHOB|nr:HAMP domain-containing sensor histidine kinase [Roseovarius gaetbuli]SLN68054.1 Sensor protein QseC [Roseovarius gaetbuli]
MRVGIRQVVGQRGSLLRRLVINISLAMVVCVLLASAIMSFEFYEHLQERTEGELRREATEILAQLDPEAEDLGLPAGSIRFTGAGGVFRYTVFDRDLRPVVGSEMAELAMAERRALLQKAQQGTVLLEGGRLGLAVKGPDERLVLVSRLSSQGSHSQLITLLDELGEQVSWVIVGIIIVLTAAIATARRAQEPLRAAVAQLRNVAPGAPDKRLSAEGMPGEIRPLIDNVNRAFDRLELGYQAQRDFSSNVAHEVRTPLAVLRSSIEGLEDGPQRSVLLEDLSGLDRMFAQLIDLARADAAGETAMGEVDLYKIALDLAREKSIPALRSKRSLAISGAEHVPARGHAGLLSVALGNLVRNALGHAPVGGEVEIELCANPPGWRVSDTGPGVPDDLKEVLFDRFQRGGASADGGAGIGLAIVRAVAEAHGGRCRIEDRPGGGAVFVFELPTA